MLPPLAPLEWPSCLPPPPQSVVLTAGAKETPSVLLKCTFPSRCSEIPISWGPGTCTYQKNPRGSDLSGTLRHF